MDGRGRILMAQGGKSEWGGRDKVTFMGSTSGVRMKDMSSLGE